MNEILIKEQSVQMQLISKWSDAYKRSKQIFEELQEISIGIYEINLYNINGDIIENGDIELKINRVEK